MRIHAKQISEGMGGEELMAVTADLSEFCREGERNGKATSRQSVYVFYDNVFFVDRNSVC